MWQIALIIEICLLSQRNYMEIIAACSELIDRKINNVVCEDFAQEMLKTCSYCKYLSMVTLSDFNHYLSPLMAKVKLRRKNKVNIWENVFRELLIFLMLWILTFRTKVFWGTRKESFWFITYRRTLLQENVI